MLTISWVSKPKAILGRYSKSWFSRNIGNILHNRRNSGIVWGMARAQLPYRRLAENYAWVARNRFEVACRYDGKNSEIGNMDEQNKSITLKNLLMMASGLVGNNEDYKIPYTRVWFVPPENGKYGRVYFGYDNWSPQGGMNDQGLFFDFFAVKNRIICFIFIWITALEGFL